MAFSLKKVFKKVCALGGALMFMSPLVSPVANAKPPESSDRGIKADNTASIAGLPVSELFNNIVAVPEDDLTWTGGQIQLFKRIEYQKNNTTIEPTLPPDFKVWFRVHKEGGTETSYTWKENITELKGTDKGTYELYYYIDGGNKYEDVGSGDSTS